MLRLLAHDLVSVIRLKTVNVVSDLLATFDSQYPFPPRRPPSLCWLPAHRRSCPRRNPPGVPAGSASTEVSTLLSPFTSCYHAPVPLPLSLAPHNTQSPGIFSPPCATFFVPVPLFQCIDHLLVMCARRAFLRNTIYAYTRSAQPYLPAFATSRCAHRTYERHLKRLQRLMQACVRGRRRP